MHDRGGDALPEKERGYSVNARYTSEFSVRELMNGASFLIQPDKQHPDHSCRSPHLPEHRWRFAEIADAPPTVICDLDEAANRTSLINGRLSAAQP
jgi:hypothetical protein